MQMIRRILVTLLLIAFGAAVAVQMLSRFAGGPISRNHGRPRPVADSSFFAHR